MTRVVLGAATGDGFAGQHWVPLSLREAGEVPEGLCTFASLALVGHRPCSYSVAMADISGLSMSKFMVCISGTLLAFVWPMRVATAMLVRGRDSFFWAIITESKKQFDEFAKNHLSHFLIRPGIVAWIPPAHSELCIGFTCYHLGIALLRH